MRRDYYEILGVAKGADGDTIKKSFRKLAMQFHPDKNPGDAEAEKKFKEAAEAYEVLSDPDKRARYDRFGHAGVSGPGAGHPGFHDVSDIFEAFGDIFGDFFGGGSPRSRTQRKNQPRRGADLRYFFEMNLNEVLTGIDREIEFDTDVGCDDCDGSGASPGTAPVNCKTCGGAGQVIRSQGFFQMASTCPTCRGQGQTIKDPCKTCHGTGRERTKRKLKVTVPAGVDQGTQLRLSEEGEGGYKGGPAGDLYVEIRVKSHPQFERDGQMLLRRVEISYVQALLGGEVEVESLDGKEKLKIPKGCQHGQLLKISGKGLPSLRSSRRGDLVSQIEVKFPSKISKKEEELLREIAKLHQEKTGGTSSWFG